MTTALWPRPWGFRAVMLLASTCFKSCSRSPWKRASATAGLRGSSIARTAGSIELSPALWLCDQLLNAHSLRFAANHFRVWSRMELSSLIRIVRQANAYNRDVYCSKRSTWSL
jgi:hypothetical protein